MGKLTDEQLPFDKRKQAKKGKRKILDGLTRKEERKQERATQWTDCDKEVYEKVAERAFNWVDGQYMCEWCKNRPAEQMHHIINRSLGGPTTEGNILYICAKCHDDHHTGRIKIWP